MNELRQQRSLQDSETSNHLISYSRLADEIDKEEEMKNGENAQPSRPQTEILLVLNEQPRIQHKLRTSGEREQNQRTEDGLDIRIYYSETANEKPKQETSSLKGGLRGQQKESSRGLIPADHLFKLTSSKIVGGAILGCIMENQSENKRSDEEVVEPQSLLESKICRSVKINSFKEFDRIKPISGDKLSIPQGGIDSRRFQQREKDINIRAIEDSVELERNEPEKIVTMRGLRDEDRKSSKEEDKKILSSLTTASKLIPKGNEIKVETEINENQYFQMMRRIAKLENEVQVILTKKRLASDSGMKSGKKQGNMASASLAKQSERKESKKNESGIKLNQLFSPQKRRSDSSECEEGDLGLLSLVNRRVWREIASISGMQISRCMKEIAKIFGLSRTFQIKNSDPFIAVFSDHQIVRVSYSKRIYVGSYSIEQENYIKDGYGIDIDPLHSIYKGQFSKGQREGQGKYITIGKYVYEGQWAAGVIEGRGTLRYQNGDRYTGSFIDGKKEGMGVERKINGDRYEGQYMNNLFHGRGAYYWANGAFYEGEFKAGKMEGSGKWRSANGDKYEGTFVNGIKSGWGMYTWKNGNTYEGEFSNGLQTKGKRHERSTKVQKEREQNSVEVFKIYFKQ